MAIIKYLNKKGNVTFTYKTGKDHHMFGKPGYGFIDVTGQTFGKLTVVEHKVGVGFLCKCDCGKEYIAKYSNELRSGRRTSCGCRAGKGRWKNSEDKILKKFAGKISSKLIADKIGRKHRNVKSRAIRLNISLSCFGQYNATSKHSDHDVEICRQLKEAGISIKSISEKMEIPVSTVCSFIYYKRRLDDAPVNSL